MVVGTADLRPFAPAGPVRPAFHCARWVPVGAALRGRVRPVGSGAAGTGGGSQWRAWALGRGTNPHGVEHLSRLWPVIANAGQEDGDGPWDTATIRRVTGAEPETLGQFLRRTLR